MDPDLCEDMNFDPVITNPGSATMERNICFKNGYLESDT